jgi:hypothetical protein
MSSITPQPNPPRRFGAEAVSYELRGLTYPGSIRENDIEQAHLVNNGWVDELPSLKNNHYKKMADMVSFGDHNVVENTYVPIRHESPVNSFLANIGRYTPEDSYVKNPVEYFTSTLIRGKELQNSTHSEFIAHPLVAAGMLQSHGDLGRGRIENKMLPVNEVFQKNFPNLVELFTKVTDPEKCRTILGDARKMMHKAEPVTQKGLFYPVLEMIQKSIK